jgi:hypothetical protein
MKSKCCFDLSLFYSQGSWTFLHVFSGHLYLFLWELPLMHVPISSLGCWFFGGWVFWVPCRFWILVPYWIVAAKIFSYSVGCLLRLVTVSFAVQKFFSLMQSHLSIVSLRWVLFRKSFPIHICSSVFPTVFWSCFNVSGLILMSLIHFELIFIQGERLGSSFSLLYVDTQLSQQHF